MSEYHRLRAVVEALPVCSACDSALATNVMVGELTGIFYGCDEHRSPGAGDLPYAEEVRAYRAAPPDPVLAALRKAPVGPPMTDAERQRFDEDRAFMAAGGEGISGDELVARLRRLRSDDPTVAAAERAAQEVRMQEYKAKVKEGRRLLSMGADVLAREVTRLRGILIECAKNHPESAEWIMAMFTPLDGSFDGPTAK